MANLISGAAKWAASWIWTPAQPASPEPKSLTAAEELSLKVEGFFTNLQNSGVFDKQEASDFIKQSEALKDTPEKLLGMIEVLKGMIKPNPADEIEEIKAECQVLNEELKNLKVVDKNVEITKNLYDRVDNLLRKIEGLSQVNREECQDCAAFLNTFKKLYENQKASEVKNEDAIIKDIKNQCELLNEDFSKYRKENQKNINIGIYIPQVTALLQRIEELSSLKRIECEQFETFLNAVKKLHVPNPTPPEPKDHPEEKAPPRAKEIDPKIVQALGGEHDPVGIPNRGNTCYVASWMQVVAANRAYSNALSANPIVKEFLKKYRSAQERKNPIDRDAITKLRNGGRGNNRQGDAAECAKKFIESITPDNHGIVNREKIGVKLAYNSFNLYTSESEEQEYENGKEYSMPEFSLNFDQEQKNLTFQKMFNSNYVDQELDTNNGKKIKTLVFKEMPNVLVFHLGRIIGQQIDGNFSIQKINDEVDIPFIHEMSISTGEKGMFALQGFTTHIGSAVGGHYVSYVFQNGKFWCNNDSRVMEVKQDQYLEAARRATSVLYQRVG